MYATARNPWTKCSRVFLLDQSPRRRHYARLLGITIHSHPDDQHKPITHEANKAEERPRDSRNVHCSQFLEEQFRGVRNVDLRYLGGVSADCTVEFLFLQVCNGHETALE